MIGCIKLFKHRLFLKRIFLAIICLTFLINFTITVPSITEDDNKLAPKEGEIESFTKTMDINVDFNINECGLGVEATVFINTNYLYSTLPPSAFAGLIDVDFDSNGDFELTNEPFDIGPKGTASTKVQYEYSEYGEHNMIVRGVFVSEAENSFTYTFDVPTLTPCEDEEQNTTPVANDEEPSTSVEEPSTNSDDEDDENITSQDGKNSFSVTSTDDALMTNTNSLTSNNSDNNTPDVDNTNTLTETNQTYDNNRNTNSDSGDSENYNLYSGTDYGVNVTEEINVTVEDIEVGNVTEVKLEKDEDTSIYKVKIPIKQKRSNLKLTISKKSEKPKDIKEDPITEEVKENPELDGCVYRYIDIKLTENETYISQEMTFVFNVSREWVNQEKVNISTIKMARYNNTWEYLDANITGVSEEYYTFETVTPGLSTFAIVGGKIAEKQGQPEQIPWYYIFLIIVVSSVVLVLILFKKRFIYLEKDNN